MAAINTCPTCSASVDETKGYDMFCSNRCRHTYHAPICKPYFEISKKILSTPPVQTIDILNLDEAGRILKCSMRVLIHLIGRGEIGLYSVGRYRFVKLSDILLVINKYKK